MSFNSYEEFEHHDFAQFMPRILTDRQHDQHCFMASNLFELTTAGVNFRSSFRVTFLFPKLIKALKDLHYDVIPTIGKNGIEHLLDMPH